MPMSNPPAAAPVAAFGDDDFGGGFGDAPAAAAAPADGFDGFGGEPVAAPTQNAGFGGDSGFGGDDVFGSAPVTTDAQPAPTATAVDFSGAGDMFSSAPAPTTSAPPPKKPSMFSNAPVVDNCETTALECVFCFPNALSRHSR